MAPWTEPLAARAARSGSRAAISPTPTLTFEARCYQAADNVYVGVRVTSGQTGVAVVGGADGLKSMTAGAPYTLLGMTKDLMITQWALTAYVPGSGVFDVRGLVYRQYDGTPNKLLGAARACGHNELTWERASR